MLRLTFLLSIFFSVFFTDANAQEKKLRRTISSSLHTAVQQYTALDKALDPTLFPRSIDTSGELVTNSRGWWTSGFFPGSLWYLYEYTQDTAIRSLAIKRTMNLLKESFNSGDHDIGFKIWCSFGNELRLTHDSSIVPVIINSAKSLSKRFDPKVGVIRSWGNIGDTKEYLVIIDNMMNLELLFEATKLSGDSSFYKIAVAHADKTLANHYRADGSSFHVVSYDPANGDIKGKRTAQGFSDSSAWARGQAWGLYGYTMCYRETHDAKYLAQANKIAHFMLDHPNVPADKIFYWDFNAPNIPNALRDASAAAITASALLELAAFANKKDASFYKQTAATIIKNLSSDRYRNKVNEQQNFLLKHSVGHLPAKSEVDVPLSYADYYYLEAMMRYKKLTD